MFQIKLQKPYRAIQSPDPFILSIQIDSPFHGKGQEVTYSYSSVNGNDPLELLRTYGFAVENNPMARVSAIIEGAFHGLTHKQYEKCLEIGCGNIQDHALQVILNKAGINEEYLNYLRVKESNEWWEGEMKVALEYYTFLSNAFGAELTRTVAKDIHLAKTLTNRRMSLAHQVSIANKQVVQLQYLFVLERAIHLLFVTLI
ncbi:hypothetical protein FGO68_gene323 [Halteria grandinella]|uniref:Uncharacterized protein n=1 Tax=Halteria grandinella TaxID=5974 RepID=A0A8J8T2B9_HALGN|nr:hypothetical protein FGO68_gene323 [Halteria grandinella]